MSEIDDVLDFWFGALDDDGRADATHRSRWFSKDPAFDREIGERFAAVREAILAGEREAWLEGARGSLAYVIVLDQLSRNMFRDSPEMYAADDLALATASRSIESGFDRDVALGQRPFFYLPLMHAENLEQQNRCVALFEALAAEHPEPFSGNLQYAIVHRDVVARFGRFPHRNEILGRPSTPEEVAFLDGGGPRF